MTHKDHISLIKDAIVEKGTWADFGSGEGAFTLALREAGGETTKIYSIDKNSDKLEVQKAEFDRMFPGADVTYITADFQDKLNLPPLDGIIMANSLHFLKDQITFLRSMQHYLKPGGIFVIVEYNVSEGNMWVPYPISFEKFQKLTAETGFTQPMFLKSIKSDFLKEIYSAVTYRNAGE